MIKTTYKGHGIIFDTYNELWKAETKNTLIQDKSLNVVKNHILEDMKSEFVRFDVYYVLFYSINIIKKTITSIPDKDKFWSIDENKTREKIPQKHCVVINEKSKALMDNFNRIKKALEEHENEAKKKLKSIKEELLKIKKVDVLC